jgi:hypothetical protein
MFIVSQTATFPTVSNSGPQSQNLTVQMPGTVSQAVAILTGFDVEYAHGDDHHLGRLDAELTVGAINGSAVAVTVVYGLRDWSGNWDDGYDGTISFAVIGE